MRSKSSSGRFWKKIKRSHANNITPRVEFSSESGKRCRASRSAREQSENMCNSTQARVRVLPATIEIWHEGRVVARHPRSYQARQQILELEHYLNVMERKPGAFAGIAALDQWREQGRWTAAYDRFWQELQRKHGAQNGTRLMIELLQLGRRLGCDKLTAAINEASEAGAIDAAAVRYLMERDSRTEPSWSRLPVEEVKRSEHYTRPIPQLDTYDRLLKGAFCSGGEQ